MFVPSVSEIYPDGEPKVRVAPGPQATILEGAHRPGHFDGVLTVVLKLLNLTKATVAFYGEKGLPAAGADPVHGGRVQCFDRDRRCADRSGAGWAGALQPQPLSIRCGSVGGAGAFPSAEGRSGRSAHGAAAVLTAAGKELVGVAVDYLELTDPALGPAPERGPARLLVAAKVGPTRLIDNVGLTLLTRDPTAPPREKP